MSFCAGLHTYGHRVNAWHVECMSVPSVWSPLHHFAIWQVMYSRFGCTPLATLYCRCESCHICTYSLARSKDLLQEPWLRHQVKQDEGKRSLLACHGAFYPPIDMCVILEPGGASVGTSGSLPRDGSASSFTSATNRRSSGT